MMHLGAESVEGMILWRASLEGPIALHRKYKVELCAKNKRLSKEFKILKKTVSETTITEIKL
jgi:hypothetical protein